MHIMLARNKKPKRKCKQIPFRSGQKYQNDGKLVNTIPTWVRYALGECVYLNGTLQRIIYAFCVDLGKVYHDLVLVTEDEKIFNICDHNNRLSVPDSVKERINEKAMVDGLPRQLAIVTIKKRGSNRMSHKWGG